MGIGLVLGLVGCSDPTFTTGDGGEGGIGVIEGGGCGLQLSPKEDRCVVDERFGVFVSASLGSPQGDGSRAKPLDKIQAGIDLAKTTNRNVYVCAEPTYREKLVLADGVSIFGYLDCNANWAVVAQRAPVTPDAIPVASASGIQKPTRIEGLEVRAPSQTMPQQSSIAVLLVSSPGLKLADMLVHAGDAGNGTDGVDAVQLTDSGSAKDGFGANGGYVCNPALLACQGGPSVLAGTNVCTGKPSITPGPGGNGGKPSRWVYNNNVWSKSQSASDGSPQPGNAFTTQGGILNGASPTAGAAGMTGPSGVTGTDVGTFDAVKLYAPSDGTAATDGSPGQGGGGGAGGELNPGGAAGAGFYFWGYAGGSGGAGGCPSLASTPGTGGAASVAILAFDSPISIDASLIETGNGGNAGKSGLAGGALLGGKGGASLNSAQGGGDGGDGGKAGASGNGGGGPSIGVVFKGPTPNVTTSTMFMLGKGGAGVAARNNDGLTPIPPSPPGKNTATFGF